jgi:hypothetical protein
MRRLRDPVRRTVRRLGWAVGAGTRRLGARTWPGAGGRTGSQRRPKQQGNRDPVTLPRPTCRWFCCRTMGRCRPGATSRAVRPAAVLADWSRRSSAPMSDLPDAVWVCAAATDEDPLWLASTTTRCSASPWSPSRGSSARPSPPLRSTRFPPFGCAWSRSTARVLACYVEDRAVLRDSCTAWRWDRVAAVIDQQLRARARARSSSRKLADLVGEVLVQEAQRERVAALAMDDSRVRAAKARAQAAEHALQAGPNRTGPTYRGPAPSPRRPGRMGAARRPTRASRRPGRLAGGWRW